MITNLIDPRMGKLMLNHLVENNLPEFCNGLFYGDLPKFGIKPYILQSNNMCEEVNSMVFRTLLLNLLSD